jgi:hypothetical protein
MGVVTTTEMKAEVRTMFGHPNETEYSDELLIRLINHAQLLDIACMYTLPELDVVKDKTLSAGATTVSLASVDFINIRGVVRALPDSMPLVEFNRQDLAGMAGYLTSPTGLPYYWMWTRDAEANDDTVLRVWPKADQEYLLKVIITRKPEDLADGDVTEFLPIWDDILTHFFASRFALELGMGNRCMAERQYAKELAAAAGYQVNHASAMWHKIGSPVNYGRNE